MSLEYISDVINYVCPIHGINSSGTISFKEEATVPQIALAEAIVSYTFTDGVLNGNDPCNMPEALGISSFCLEIKNKKFKTELTYARQIREAILNRLMGIAFVAKESGDAATVSSVITARQALLDLTKAPSVLAATTPEELKTAVKIYYASVASGVPSNVKTAFKDLDL